MPIKPNSARACFSAYIYIYNGIRVVFMTAHISAAGSKGEPVTLVARENMRTFLAVRVLLAHINTYTVCGLDNNLIIFCGASV